MSRKYGISLLASALIAGGLIGGYHLFWPNQRTAPTSETRSSGLENTSGLEKKVKEPNRPPRQFKRREPKAVEPYSLLYKVLTTQSKERLLLLLGKINERYTDPVIPEVTNLRYGPFAPSKAMIDAFFSGSEDLLKISLGEGCLYHAAVFAAWEGYPSDISKALYEKAFEIGDKRAEQPFTEATLQRIAYDSTLEYLNLSVGGENKGKEAYTPVFLDLVTGFLPEDANLAYLNQLRKTIGVDPDIGLSEALAGPIGKLEAYLRGDSDLSSLTQLVSANEILGDKAAAAAAVNEYLKDAWDTRLGELRSGAADPRATSEELTPLLPYVPETTYFGMQRAIDPFKKPKE